MLAPTFLERSDNSTQKLAPPVKFTVKRMCTRAIGGCYDAEIEATGGELDLWALSAYLRCPVIIRDEIARPAWWGFVNRVSIQAGAWMYEISLDEMANRVAVAYSYIEPGTNLVGYRRTTAWDTNAESQGEYGVKDKLVMTGGMTPGSAEQMRDTVLAARKFPQGGVMFTGGVDTTATRAILSCVGWYQSLAWRMCDVAPVAAIAYMPASLGAGAVGIGYSNTEIKKAQSFTTGTVGQRIFSVTAVYSKAGTPADTNTVSLQALTAGTPSGIALASATFAATSIAASAATLTHAFTEYEMSPATQYALVWERSGSVSSSNYIGLGYGTSTIGTLFYYGTAGGGTWAAQAIDVWFSVNVNDSVEPTEQIKDIVDNYGQFIVDVTIDNTVGTTTPSYRNGDTNCMTEVTSLLSIGGTADNLRLLAEVDYNRYMRIFAEQANTTISYYMTKKGELTDAAGGVIPPHLWPVGVWVRLRDVIGVTASLYNMADPALQYLEGWDWDGMSSKAMPLFRGVPAPESLFEAG